MRTLLRSVLIAAIGILLITAPALAQVSQTGEGDPRAQVENVEVIVDDDDEIWVKIQFAEGQDQKPPLDLFSFYVQLYLQVRDFFISVEWLIHDDVVQPAAFDGDGDFVPEMYILADGCVLMNTGLTTDQEVPGINGQVYSGSWLEELTSEAVFEIFQFDIPPEDFIEGDPFELFAPAVYDLTQGEMVSQPETTTTTLAAVSQPETTTTTLAAVSQPETTTTTLAAVSQPETTTTERTSTVPRTSETCWSCWTVILVLFLVLLCVIFFWLKRYEWWSGWIAWFFVIWVWAPFVLVWLVFFGPGVWWWWILLLVWFPVIGWGWWWWARRRSWWRPSMWWLPVGWMVVLVVAMMIWQPAWWWLLPLFWLPAAGFYLWYRPRRVPWWRPWMWWGFGAWVLWFFVWAIWLGAGWVWWFPVVFFPILGWWIWRSATRTWAYWGPKLCWLIPWAFLPWLGWWIFVECIG